MLLQLLNANIDAFLELASYLPNIDLLSLCDVSPEFNYVISSQPLKHWKLAGSPPLQQTFLLPIERMPSDIVADDQVVGLAVGHNVFFFSNSSGLLVSQFSIPWMYSYQQNIQKMCLNENLLALLVGSTLMLIDRDDMKLISEHALPSGGSTLTACSSVLVVGGGSGYLGFLTLPAQGQINFANDPRQAEVHSMDCDMVKTVVSFNDKILVWSNHEASVSKVIQRVGSLTVMYEGELVANYSGTALQLANDIVVTPALGVDAAIEVWNINTGDLVHRIEEHCLNFSLKFPYLNLEYCGQSKVFDLDAPGRPELLRVFSDMVWPIDLEMDPYHHPRHTVLTRFQHITVGYNLDESGEFLPGGIYKMKVRSFITLK